MNMNLLVKIIVSYEYLFKLCGQYLFEYPEQ
jgi:hypothetical protein